MQNNTIKFFFSRLKKSEWLIISILDGKKTHIEVRHVGPLH